MFDLSLHAANSVWGISNSVLIVGAALVLVGTIGAIWTGGIRERYADERVTRNEAEAAAAKKDIEVARADALQSLASARQAEANLAGANARAEEARASAADAFARSAEAKAESAQSLATAAEAQSHLAEANARAAEANQKAAQATLELERLKTPRTLRPEQRHSISRTLLPWSGQTVSFTVTVDPESISLLKTLRDVLAHAGWKAVASQIGDIAIDGAGVATGVGVEIQVHPKSARGTTTAGAANALAHALKEQGIDAIPVVNSELKLEDTLNVMVGKKPQ